MEIAILSIIDKIYPVGSYYETSDENFDPNISWGGYWIKDTDGLVTVGATEFRNGKALTIGAALPIVNQSISGSSKVKLTVDEMPKHAHPSRAVGETHTQFINDSYDHISSLCLASNSAGNNKGWSDFSTDLENVDNDFVGEDQPHINYQPSIGIIRWHRVNPCIYSKISYLSSKNYINSQEGEMKYFETVNAAETYINDSFAIEVKLGAIGKTVTSLQGFFESSNIGLTKIDISELDTSQVTNTNRMFYACKDLEEVNMGTNDFSKVTNSGEMLTSVPSNCLFIVKDQTTKNWLLSIRSDLTNVQIQ